MSISLQIPLPSTTDWPTYPAPALIPYGFGRVTVEGIPLNNTQTRWIFLAGRNGGVDRVTVDGEQVNDWEWSNTVDPAGRPVTVVEFNSSQRDVVIAGRGHLDPDTPGQLITNPGRVIKFIYSLYNKTPVDIDLLISEAAKRSLSVAGVLSGTETGRKQIADIAQSVGMVWADSRPGFGVFLPTTATPRKTIGNADGLSADYSFDDIATVMRVNFARNAATGDYEGSVLLESPDAIETYGRIEAQIDAAWIPNSRQALALGQNELARRARPRWDYTSTVQGLIYPGDRITVAHPVAPVSASCTVTQADIDYQGAQTTVVMEALAGEAPTIVVTQISEAVATSGSTPLVTVLDDSVEIVITTTDGQVLPGARAVLDGSVTRTADNGGVVTFPRYLLPPGTEHTIVATKTGFAPVQITFTA